MIIACKNGEALQAVSDWRDTSFAFKKSYSISVWTLMELLTIISVNTTKYWFLESDEGLLMDYMETRKGQKKPLFNTK